MRNKVRRVVVVADVRGISDPRLVAAKVHGDCPDGCLYIIISCACTRSSVFSPAIANAISG